MCGHAHVCGEQHSRQGRAGASSRGGGELGVGAARSLRLRWRDGDRRRRRSAPARLAMAGAVGLVRWEAREGSEQEFTFKRSWLVWEVCVCYSCWKL